MSDLIIDVRQVSSYPNLPASNGTETILVQQGGLGGPYASISSSALVSTALNESGPLGIGVTPPQSNETQVFSNNFVVAPEGGILFNLYWTGTTAASWQGGYCGGCSLDPGTGALVWELGSGQAGSAATLSGVMALSLAGNLTLPHGTLTVARDPAFAFDVATANWVSNNTVHSFNNRNGQVQLNADDVYSALKLCDPIATQAWVNQAITNSIQNLLVTCPFVNRWNNRTGSVYLMLSDITTVFFQPGQQPITQTPPPNSDDNSIPTTGWINHFYTPAPTQPTPPMNPTSGQLWWNDTDGNLYVYYQDPTSAQWVSAMADGGGGGGGGGTISGVTAGTGLAGGGTTGTVTVSLATPVAVDNGGTGAITASAALASLGAAPINSPVFTGPVTIPGGTIDNTVIGGTTRAVGNFTTVNSAQLFALTGGLLGQSNTDLTQGAVALFGTTYGINVTAATINVIAGGVNVGEFTSGGVVCANVGLPQAGGLVAAGTSQATALALTTPYSNVATVAAGTGVRLPAQGTTVGTALVGSRYVVWNHGANTLNVYPASGEGFFGLGADAPITIASNAKAALVYWGGLWIQED